MLHPLVGSQQEQDRRARPLLRTTLGEVLRRRRLEQGRTLADVARAATVSMQYLSELERGRKEASSEVLAAICDALEAELPDVLAEVGRDLAGAAQRPATVLRLGARLDRRAASAQPGSGDLTCLLAA
ncbi:MAG: helix-turn-helix transcriptional regulator [Streptosporangiaceae bacterium]